MNNSKSAVLLIGAILAAVASALFFFLNTTVLALVAYFVTLFGIVVFCGGKLFLLNNTKGFPWVAAFPMVIWRYLTLQITVSAVFLVPENLFDRSLPVLLYIAVQGALAALFAIYLVSMKAGKDIIDQRGAEVKQKISALRMMQLDVETLMREHPEHEADLKKVAEAIRYSDPMSHPSLAIYEEEIGRTIFSMQGLEGNDPANIPKICEKLLKQIADRNSRVRLMK